tara:strand:+ start:123 stop:320 length:198 start_codon:yes stop_codon:yes gene_type:complete
MKSGFMEYKTVVFIKDVLNKQLNKQKKRLVDFQKDKNCSTETYENQLDFCNKLEYAIKEMEKFKI